MNKKIIGILVMTLLIAVSVSSVTGIIDENDTVNMKNDECNNLIKQQFFDKTPVPLPTMNGWTKIFGGTGQDEAYCVQQADDGGYILTGYTYSSGAGSDNVWLIKTDGSGNKLWDKTFGGTDDDHARCVQQTDDGGYILTGYTYSYGAGERDAWLVKTDNNGNKPWDKTYGGTGWDVAYCVQGTDDGGYILTGYTGSYGAGFSDFWLIKTDSNGNKLWDKTYGGTDSDVAYCVQGTDDGGYILTGYTGSYGAGSDDVWLIKTDSSGNKLWDKTYGGTEEDCAYCVQQTDDDGYILAGYTYSYGAGWKDFWLIKTDGSGNKLWDKTFGGTGPDVAYCVQQTDDGGYILTGYTGSYSVLDDGWLVKTDGSGNKLWDKTYGGTSGDDTAYSVQQTNDGGYILTGYTYSYGAVERDVWLIKTDANGESISKEPPLFMRFLENHPHLFPLLRQLLKL